MTMAEASMPCSVLARVAAWAHFWRPSGVVGPWEVAPLARDAAIRRGDEGGMGAGLSWFSGGGWLVIAIPGWRRGRLGGWCLEEGWGGKWLGVRGLGGSGFIFLSCESDFGADAWARTRMKSCVCSAGVT